MESEEAKLVFCLVCKATHMSFVQQNIISFQALRGNNSQYSYVWIIPGWYADRWWTKGGDVVLDNGKCNTADLAEFIVQQRVIAISHQPYVLNMTSQEDGVCVSLQCSVACSWFMFARALDYSCIPP